MANTIILSDAELERLSSGPAGSHNYLRQKEMAIQRFKNHVKKTSRLNFNDVVKNDAELDRTLKSYFFGIQVQEMVSDIDNPGKFKKTGSSVPPKLGYAKNVKTLLFGVLSKEFKVI